MGCRIWIGTSRCEKTKLGEAKTVTQLRRKSVSRPRYRTNLPELGLADEHGANAKAHQEESAKAVEQIHAALQLQAVTVDNCDSHDCDESVERMERRELELLLVHHGDAKCNLHEDRELSDACVPPQCTCTQWSDLVRSERPDTSKSVADNGHPGPRLVKFSQSCEHRTNLVGDGVNYRMRVSASPPVSTNVSTPPDTSKVVTEQLSRLAIMTASFPVATPMTALIATK